MILQYDLVYVRENKLIKKKKSKIPHNSLCFGWDH